MYLPGFKGMFKKCHFMVVLHLMEPAFFHSLLLNKLIKPKKKLIDIENGASGLSWYLYYGLNNT